MQMRVDFYQTERSAASDLFDIQNSAPIHFLLFGFLDSFAACRVNRQGRAASFALI